MNAFYRRVALLSLAGLPWLAAPIAQAAAPPPDGPVQVIGDYTLYFGILPSAITQGAPHSEGPRDAHGLPRGDFAREHHLLVVVERSRDRQRPTDAQVIVQVPIDGSTVTRTLVPMPINGSMSYGGVFVLPGAGRYLFTTTVRLPQRKAPIIARFAYTLGHGSSR
jgi:hypothetical protein